MEYESPDPYLEGIVREFGQFPGMLRKRPVGRVVEKLKEQEIMNSIGVPWTHGARGNYTILADFGEDAAILLPEDGAGALLLAADGIVEELVKADPFWAGYCSVMVNVQDVAACGGQPLAAVNVVSARDEAVLESVMDGILEGCEKFGVFMAGGHTHPDAEHDSISVAILGRADPGSLVFSHTAKAGDALIFALELKGERRTRFGWDSTYRLTPAEVRRRLALPGRLASMDLVTAGKDISNPGCLGTAAMLLESSGLGARIRVDAIPHPPGDEVPFREWLKLYQGCGFVLTTSEENAHEVCREFERTGMAAAVCGALHSSKEITIERQRRENPGMESAILIDLGKDSVTGISPNKQKK